MEANRYKDTVQMLHFGGLLMWPPLQQLLWAGLKDPDVALLDLIAQQSRMLHSWTTTLNLQGSIDDAIAPDTVLKRSHSDCGQLVILPEERRRQNAVQLEALAPHGEKWLIQEHIRTLRTVGEWQAFIVNGAVIHTIHMYKDPDTSAWVARQVLSFWSLEEIWYLVPHTASG